MPQTTSSNNLFQNIMSKICYLVTLAKIKCSDCLKNSFATSKRSALFQSRVIMLCYKFIKTTAEPLPSLSIIDLMSLQSQHLFLLLGYTKLLVATGKAITGLSNTVEIIDLESSKSTCDSLNNYPLKVYGLTGGLNQNSKPFLCGGRGDNDVFHSSCFTYEQETWQQTSSLNEPRYHGSNALKFFGYHFCLLQKWQNFVKLFKLCKIRDFTHLFNKVKITV